MDWINQRVRFKIRDVYHPDPIKILSDLHGNDLLTGRIIDLSDRGMQQNVFAVVEVEALQELLVVPMNRIVGTSENRDAGEPP